MAESTQLYLPSRGLHSSAAAATSTCDIMNSIGNTQYSENDKLGRGASATVYRGVSMRNIPNPRYNSAGGVGAETKEIVEKKTVAVKHVILKTLTSTQMEWIDREIKILTALSTPPHRHIVTLFNCERKETDIYFVMELCKGGSLLEYLNCKQKLDEDTIKIFLKQIANGLMVAHCQNIIHRDLKPENLLLCFNGERYPAPKDITLKIADFGFGRYLQEGVLAFTWGGTQNYMAPEVLFYRETGYDYKADLWSVGVITYQCLVGSLPKAPIATCISRLEIPETNNPALHEMLVGLLQEDPANRLNSKKFLNHQFLETIISVTVSGPTHRSRMIKILDNAGVDELIDKVCDLFALDQESTEVYLIHCGSKLERGKGDSLLDAGIYHNDTITFVMRAPGG